MRDEKEQKKVKGWDGSEDEIEMAMGVGVSEWVSEAT
jgi:hypothetical protein